MKRDRISAYVFQLKFKSPQGLPAAIEAIVPKHDWLEDQAVFPSSDRDGFDYRSFSAWPDRLEIAEALGVKVNRTERLE